MADVTCDNFKTAFSSLSFIGTTNCKVTKKNLEDTPGNKYEIEIVLSTALSVYDWVVPVIWDSSRVDKDNNSTLPYFSADIQPGLKSAKFYHTSSDPDNDLCYAFPFDMWYKSCILPTKRNLKIDKIKVWGWRQQADTWYLICDTYSLPTGKILTLTWK